MKSSGDKIKCGKRREKRNREGKLSACNGCSSAPKSETGRGQSFSSLVAAAANSKGAGNKVPQTAST